jgi:ATP-dependent protease Clp ATPase subunit
LKEAFIEQYQRVSELKKIQLSFNQEFILNSHKLCV